jgi:hypothetical protein
MSPIGAIAAGAAADQIGVAMTLTIGGIATALAGLYLLQNRKRLVIPAQPRV